MPQQSACVLAFPFSSPVIYFPPSVAAKGKRSQVSLTQCNPASNEARAAKSNNACKPADASLIVTTRTTKPSFKKKGKGSTKYTGLIFCVRVVSPPEIRVVLLLRAIG